ncbi:MAG: DUF523 and DUF1722 domain-containing protein [Pseudodesulfovibrio sp.]|uniref:DUF1722 domain-containing protein n=1 Tax=Pseudodesulfovibrio aespoeensis (strain ATCC 700646 / DSM 10631 / Aspo-2) TaxID=643562 RepID=E6VU22_PSEA9|nr:MULTISPECIES: DUF523 and DUF1722 domain-containing protein [Pseudodesulfovibrio]MBU4192911.1 DUF523 and DUF1722 domain-containing protein [Pseudomonadota bacterium]ADU62215.1 protein of unknown function DUF523 [Pseudodesulfovibrio aespoeensis Aspo-2]MBU4243186.1 DUF523 and DUF1722 domain-containing protein [Pseudomonadota bacterium]MBU4379481.1 DUF523 and DUF1722 domain-containing protein [Pseudomonadota bacterium]MBU4476095.1 DUF523 and DUF1722 domain-containing protein [Pseudomonadota bac
MDNPIRIGISTCLLGEKVRYDGGHAHAHHVTALLADRVEFHPVCPEVGCGMGIPREPVRLVGTPESCRLVGRESGADWTGRMTAWAQNALDELADAGLCGFIFKAKSPSSGMTRIKVYPENGGQSVSHAGVGLFARLFMERFPLLPVEDEGRLHDIGLRANFLERVFVQHRWNSVFMAEKTMKGLINFHTSHKMLLRSHDIPTYRKMGSLVAGGKTMPRDELFDHYGRLLAQAMAHKPTARKNADVLMHAMGYFKAMLTADEKQECLEIIENYKKEMIPLIVPITLMNHYVRKYGVHYLKDQCYLAPHPLELKLRNHA